MKHGWTPDTPTSQQATRPPCLSGCMRAGQHQPMPTTEVRSDVCTLPCADDCTKRCREHCRGCVPRLAEQTANGTILAVCSGCAGRIRRALDNLPGLVAWIRSQDFKTLPNGFGGDGTGIGGARTPPAPIRIDALDASDELHAMLAAWCRVIVEEHPAGFRGPDLRGSVRSRAVLADMTGPVIGLAGIGGRMNFAGNVTAVPPTERAAAWLGTHLDWALGREWADEIVREISGAVETAEHRWPRGGDTHDGERANANCFECGGVLVRPYGDTEFACHGCSRKYSWGAYCLAIRARLEQQAEEQAG